MSTQFPTALSLVLRHEGGYSNHVLDPGGSTFMGITQRTLDRVRLRMPDLPARVIDLAADQIAMIYRVEYWDPIKGDSLPPGLDLMVFDAAVNQGQPTAVRLLQLAARVRDDGVLGPVTLQAVWQRERRGLLKEYAARRMHHYMLLDRLDDTFGLGWSRRLIDVFAAALRIPS